MAAPGLARKHSHSQTYSSQLVEAECLQLGPGCNCPSVHAFCAHLLAATVAAEQADKEVSTTLDSVSSSLGTVEEELLWLWLRVRHTKRGKLESSWAASSKCGYRLLQLCIPTIMSSH